MANEETTTTIIIKLEITGDAKRAMSAVDDALDAGTIQDAIIEAANFDEAEDDEEDEDEDESTDPFEITSALADFVSKA